LEQFTVDLLNVVIRADTAGADRANAALDKMTAGARQADAAISSLGSHSAGGMSKVTQAADAAAAANQRLAASARGASLNTANIAAQFQDVGVTAAMGMNPMMIALQQGTQLSIALTDAARTSGGAMKALGSAFLTVVSPVALATIAVVGLAAAVFQMIDWTEVGKAALSGLAAGLEMIAPYAAVAAGGLALFYSPAIIAGIWSVTTALAGMATQAVITGAAMIAANPVAAIVLGLAAVATAMVIFRDDLAKVLGFDIVQAAQDGINWIIGTFVGGFEGIKAVWGELPAAIGDIAISTANSVIGGIESMLNTATTKINEWIRGINDKLSILPDWARIPELGTVDFGEIPNPNAGKAGDVTSAIGAAMTKAQEVDYVGAGISMIQGAASGAADALRGLAGQLGESSEGSKKAAKEAQRQAEAYSDLTRGASEFIEAEKLKAQSLGMTEEAAARLKYTQDLLNKAANDNIALTDAQRAEIEGLGAAMAAAEEATRRITDIYNFGKSTFAGFFEDFRQGIGEGKSLWESFANAATNAMDKIASKLMEQAANGLWDILSNVGMSALTGSMGTIGVNGVGIPSTPFIPGITGPMLLASGGLVTGPGSATSDSIPARLSNGEFVLNASATRRIGVGRLNAANSGAANQNSANQNFPRGDVHIHVNGSSLTQAEMSMAIGDALEKYDRFTLPQRVAAINNDPLARG
jgi:hypothetical protein